MLRLWKRYNYVIIFAGVVFALGIYMVFGMQDDTDQYKKIVVGEGQTLWKIADKYTDSGSDSLNRSEFIQWVENHNKIDGNIIKAGEKIIIPVKKENNREAYREIALK